MHCAILALFRRTLVTVRVLVKILRTHRDIVGYTLIIGSMLVVMAAALINGGSIALSTLQTVMACAAVSVGYLFVYYKKSI
jgi:hypothetical protein